MITHIIWDFNGTVLNDVDASVAAVNDMLKARGLPPTTKTKYTQTVSMPLDRYYTSVGIDSSDMEALSIEFRGYCNSHSELLSVFDGFYTSVSRAASLKLKSILMSSLYIGFLNDETEKYGITEYFDEILGTENKLVGTKLKLAEDFIGRNGLNPRQLLFVGDLTSDAELAKSIGAECVLIPNGHNSKARCLTQEVTVLDDISMLAEYLEKA